MVRAPDELRFTTLRLTTAWVEEGTVYTVVLLPPDNADCPKIPDAIFK